MSSVVQSSSFVHAEPRSEIVYRWWTHVIIILYIYIFFSLHVHPPSPGLKAGQRVNFIDHYHRWRSIFSKRLSHRLTRVYVPIYSRYNIHIYMKNVPSFPYSIRRWRQVFYLQSGSTIGRQLISGWVQWPGLSKGGSVYIKTRFLWFLEKKKPWALWLTWPIKVKLNVILSKNSKQPPVEPDISIADLGTPKSTPSRAWLARRSKYFVGPCLGNIPFDDFFSFFFFLLLIR